MIIKIFGFIFSTIDNKQAINEKRCYISNIVYNLLVIINTVGPTKLWNGIMTFMAIFCVFDSVVYVLCTHLLCFMFIEINKIKI